MIVSKRNQLLYDSLNFDNYFNNYAILKSNMKDIKIDMMQHKNEIFVSVHLEELYFDFYNIRGKLNYKIIFGHFYNNSDFFLYKNVLNGKTIGYSIKKCKRNELYFNEHNDLLHASSYDQIKQQLVYIKEQKNQIDSPTLNYKYDNHDNMLCFYKSNINIAYTYDVSNECLIINKTITYH